MSKRRLILLAGLWLVLLPFLGFPPSWDNVFIVITGTFVIIIGLHGFGRRRFNATDDNNNDDGEGQE